MLFEQREQSKLTAKSAENLQHFIVKTQIKLDGLVPVDNKPSVN